MTPEEKALIDAKREGFTQAARRMHAPPAWIWIDAEAAREYPYPPAPEEYVDACGDHWRYVGGVLEYRVCGTDLWGAFETWLTPDFIRGLHALLPPSTEEAPR